MPKTYTCARCGAGPFPTMTAHAVHVTLHCAEPNYDPHHCQRCATPVDPRVGPTCPGCGFDHPLIQRRETQ